KWGTGGINIDDSRVGVSENDLEAMQKKNDSFKGANNKEYNGIQFVNKDRNLEVNTLGRFPANIILDEEAGKLLDEQTGISKSTNKPRNNKQSVYAESEGRKYGKYNDCVSYGFSDTGGASRFFYCAKASKSERNLGCDELEEKIGGSMEANITETMQLGGASLKGEPKQIQPTKNNHPTVKPVALMEYLIKLVSRENAIVLDPFLGSGTTAIACLKTNRKFIGIEKEPEYIKIAEARIKPYLEQRKLLLEEEQDD
ncbi:MAG TPA: site-specific DNA-methyltransferase, partial [Candidatus Pacearchaeota archaeon]|nr:site-specific DNA-methyltransferase [Candidatus Pacearchaeota archaeon]